MLPRINADGAYYYGYHWWCGRTLLRGRSYDWAAGLGFGGQRLYVVPDLDLVVAINSGHYGEPSRLQLIIPSAIFSRLIMPAIRG